MRGHSPHRGPTSPLSLSDPWAPEPRVDRGSRDQETRTVEVRRQNSSRFTFSTRCQLQRSSGAGDTETLV